MKNKVYMLVAEIDVNKGGMTRSMMNRSNFLTEEGYNADLITLDFKINYDEITNTLKKHGRLHPKVDIINIYDYYKNKNTKKGLTKKQLEYYQLSSRLFETEYKVLDKYKKEGFAKYFQNGLYVKYKRWTKNNMLSHIDYFDESRSRILREEFHTEGYVYRKIYFDFKTNSSKQELYFTKDGYCFLSKWINPNNGKLRQIFLFDRQSAQASVFNSNKEFHVYWLNELCNRHKKKPYLICDGPGSAPKVSNMAKGSAFKIYTIHTNHFSSPHELGSPIKKNHIHILENLKNEDALVVLTKSQKNDIVQQFGDYGNVHVIPNSVKKTKKNNKKRDKNLVVAVGRYHPEKRLDEAIYAFRDVVDQLPNARLELYGDGPDKEKLRSIIKELELQDNVYLMGYSFNIEQVYKTAIVTLLTSKYEGLSLTLLESMVCGTPAISYDVKYSPSDIIEDKVTGFLIPDGDRKQLSYESNN